MANTRKDTSAQESQSQETHSSAMDNFYKIIRANAELAVWKMAAVPVTQPIQTMMRVQQSSLLSRTWKS